MSKLKEAAREKPVKTIFKADFNLENSRRKIAEFSEKYPAIAKYIVALRQKLLTSQGADLLENPEVYVDYFIGEVLDVNAEFLFPSKKTREFRDPIDMVISSEEGHSEEVSKAVSEPSRIDKIDLNLPSQLSFFRKRADGGDLLKTFVEKIEEELEKVEKIKAPIEAEFRAALDKKIADSIEEELKDVSRRKRLARETKIRERMMEEGKKEFEAKVRENPEDIELAMIVAKAYKCGFGVTCSNKKAFEIYKKYADKGYPSAQYELANLCAKGVEDQDPNLLKLWARRYYGDAARKGNFLAQYEFDRPRKVEPTVVGFSGIEQESLDENIRLWDEERRFDVRLKIADCYAMGIGTEVDSVKAAFLYLKAAQRYKDLDVVPIYSEVRLDNEENSKLKAEEIIDMMEMEAFEAFYDENLIRAAEALEFNEENLKLNLEARKKLDIAEMVIDNFANIIEVSKEELSLEDLTKIYKKFTSIRFLDVSRDASEGRIPYAANLVCEKIATSMMEKLSARMGLDATVFEDIAAPEGLETVLISNFRNDSFTIRNLPISQKALKSWADNFGAVNFSSEIAEDGKLVVKVKIDEPLEAALTTTPEVRFGLKGVRQLSQKKQTHDGVSLDA